VVTRAREKASELRSRLEAFGAEVLELPSIAFDASSDADRLRRAVAAGIGRYDWVVFTSPTGVERTVAAISEAGLDARAFAGSRIAAIGPGTAAALAASGLRSDLVPEDFVAEALAEAMPDGPGRVVLFRAEEAREVLPDRLAAKGWTVDVIPAYRTVLGEGDADARRHLQRGEVDAVTFTSSSTVTNFLRLVGEVPRPPVIACIGPVTARTAEERGWPPTVVAATSTLDGLVEALCRSLSPR
ncbi:MAG: uroporphyrinogen-III synthase, partial [Chloroflexota bacterium]|nr:uroporphyrinogen-III synthase [Chloroflexota bacterium]